MRSAFCCCAFTLPSSLLSPSDGSTSSFTIVFFSSCGYVRLALDRRDSPRGDFRAESRFLHLQLSVARDVFDGEVVKLKCTGGRIRRGVALM
jgi:hypothetical protein